jgi:hypothetical protein
MGDGGRGRCAVCAVLCGLRSADAAAGTAGNWGPGNWEELGTGNDLVSGILVSVPVPQD